MVSRSSAAWSPEARRSTRGELSHAPRRNADLVVRPFSFAPHAEHRHFARSRFNAKEAS